MRGVFKDSEQWKRLSSLEWNLLIILDACRPDYLTTFQGEPVESIDALSQHTFYFAGAIQEWFVDTPLVYFNGNPLVYKRITVERKAGKNDCINLIDLWPQRWKESGVDGQWRDKEPTVIQPEMILNEFLKYIFIRGQPRHAIIHFMQPHFPFIGHPEFKPSITHQARYPQKEQFWDSIRKAYSDNLAAVLPFAERASESIGRVIVTADHGEFLGEGNWYGHNTWLGEPRSVYKPVTPELAKSILGTVPWWETGEYDPTLYPSVPLESEEIDDEVLKERLRSLGYV